MEVGGKSENMVIDPLQLETREYLPIELISMGTLHYER